jgi:phage terminase large subunit
MDVYQQVLLPTLTIADGRVLIETTLNGYNGFKDFYDEAPRMGFNILHMGLDDFVKHNIITQAVYEKEEAKYHPDYFRQEFLCQWVTYTGSAYPEFDAGHIAEIEPPKDGEPIYVSIDWGYSPSATAALFAVYRGNQLQVYAEHYALQEHAHTTAQRLHEETLRFPGSPMRIVGDHEPDRMDTLRAHGIQAANADKREVLGSRTRIKELLYFDRLAMSPTCTYLRRDLQSAVWSGKKDGEIDSKICTWGHYDCEAALRYMIDSFGFI